MTNKTDLITLINTSLTDGGENTAAELRAALIGVVNSNLNLDEVLPQTLSAGVNFNGNFIENLPNDVGFELVLEATSVASDQTPTGIGSALQIEFGPAINVPGVLNLNVDGSIDISQTAQYLVLAEFNTTRSGFSSASQLFFRGLIDGVQIGPSRLARLDDSQTAVNVMFYVPITAVAGTTFTAEMVRDSGSNSGHLHKFTPATAGWSDAPTSRLRVFRLNVEDEA